MPKERNIEELPAEDLEALTTAKADWDGIAEESLPEDDDKILAEVLGIEPELEGDVIEEDDDNPYQESDEALPDDDEERDIARQLLPD